jgi:hypothetical protein
MKIDLNKRLKDLEKKVETETKKIKKSKKNKPTNIFWQIFNVVIFIIIIINIYSLAKNYFREKNNVRKEVKVSMSEIVKNLQIENDIISSTSSVKNILIDGEEIRLDVGTNTTLVSKKEINESLLDVLKNYGVGTSTLSNINIKIKDDSIYKF